MDEGIETWQLHSGVWHRNVHEQSWRFAGTTSGAVASERLTDTDLIRLVGAKRADGAGNIFPPDFSFSPLSGRELPVVSPPATASWLPPYGAVPISDMAKPSTRGLRQTSCPLKLHELTGGKKLFDPGSEGDVKLAPLPPGDYRFVVDPFDTCASVLLAIDAGTGSLFVWLEGARCWAPLEHAAGGMLAECPRRIVEWRMEAHRSNGVTTLYLPTVEGLAIVVPQILSLTYAVDYVGDGSALGAPVAWAGEVWMPAVSPAGEITLLGKPAAATQPLILSTRYSAPAKGFAAPVLEARQVVWPCDEGQLVLRINHDGKETTEWLSWPEGSSPTFQLGSPYLSRLNSFWQPCWVGNQDSLEYVQMGRSEAESFAIDAPRLSTGQVSYKKNQRIKGDPWLDPAHAYDGASTDVVIPLIESSAQAAVVGLTLEAPDGLLALLESTERQRAVLQLQADNCADIRFGTLMVSRPWLSSVFVYNQHLWIYHAEMPEPLGWKLDT